MLILAFFLRPSVPLGFSSSSDNVPARLVGAAQMVEWCRGWDRKLLGRIWRRCLGRALLWYDGEYHPYSLLSELCFSVKRHYSCMNISYLKFGSKDPICNNSPSEVHYLASLMMVTILKDPTSSHPMGTTHVSESRRQKIEELPHGSSASKDSSFKVWKYKQGPTYQSYAQAMSPRVFHFPLSPSLLFTDFKYTVDGGKINNSCRPPSFLPFARAGLDGLNMGWGLWGASQSGGSSTNDVSKLGQRGITQILT